LDKLTKWLPGDALVLYVAGITAFQTTSVAGSWTLLAVMWVVCVLLVAGGAMFPPQTADRLQSVNRTSWAIMTVVTMVVTAVAFGVWSLTVPGSAWQHWSLIHDNGPGVTWAASLLAVVYGAIVDPAVDWMKGKTLDREARKLAASPPQTAQPPPPPLHPPQ
jgi:hypothetical protein